MDMVVDVASVPAFARQYHKPTSESLNFTVQSVTSDHQLEGVQRLREIAYGHHLPALSKQFGRPDPLDRDPDVVVFAATDKATGEIVGSCRIQINRTQTLQIQSCIDTPEYLKGKLLSEITRLCVLPAYGDRLVRMALVKACHLHNIGMQVAGILAGSRRALIRQYRALGFLDLFDDEREVPLSYSGGLLHRVLWLDSVCAETNWFGMKHPYYRFIFRTWHPDINILTCPSLSKSFYPDPLPMPISHDVSRLDLSPSRTSSMSDINATDSKGLVK